MLNDDGNRAGKNDDVGIWHCVYELGPRIDDMMLQQNSLESSLGSLPIISIVSSPSRIILAIELPINPSPLMRTVVIVHHL